MRIILIGCEYAGKTTLAGSISRWWREHAGGTADWHDHFVRPFLEETGPEAEAEAQQVLQMRPALLEKYSRYMLEYHLNHAFYQDNHHLLVNWHYADAVYAPLYYGYGHPDVYGDRQKTARTLDEAVMRVAPDTVLVLLRASPDAIGQRLRKDRHPHCPLAETDIEAVLQRFEEEYERSRIRRKFALETTASAAQETLQRFLQEMEPHLGDRDQRALLVHAQLR